MCGDVPLASDLYLLILGGIFSRGEVAVSVETYQMATEGEIVFATCFTNTAKTNNVIIKQNVDEIDDDPSRGVVNT